MSIPDTSERSGTQISSSYPSLALFIDGEWHGAADRRTRPVIDPSCQKVLGHLPIADEEDVTRAIDSAVRGFHLWQNMSALERARILHRIGEALRSKVDILAPVLTREQGKPLAEARAELVSSADTFEWAAGEGQRLYGRIVPSRFIGADQSVYFEPVGPVAALSPWNFPAVLSVRKVASALAAGCSVLLKPAEETPGVVVEIVRLCQECGLPDGVLNLLFGDPADISQRLISSPGISKLSFTGSVPVGRSLAALAGAALKPVTLELGGHSPVIVCEDADVDRVATLAAIAKFRNAGQVCHGPTRFIVHEKVYDRFVSELAGRATRLRVGFGLDPSTQMGPLIGQRRVDAMQALTDDARRLGAEIVCGGTAGRAIDKALDTGFFWLPTVIAQPPLHLRAMREEPFGPMALVTNFSDFDAALAVANATDYGLGAYVFTGSLATARRLRDGLQAGSIGINTFAAAPPEMPFSGTKHSGIGSEMGHEGVRAYLHMKSVIVMSG